jgi:hypothetical protein
MSGDLWIVDPLPVPPSGVSYGSAAWWRWWSKVTLAARKAA